jgi:adenosylcobinamide-GDP ribazoletransferase
VKALREGWLLAVGTLTVFPSGPVRTTPEVARAMVAMAPLAVLPLALGAAAVSRGGNMVGLPGLVVGLLVVAWLAAGTRALHLDGVADVADGFGGGWEPERARAILKRGDVGPMGAVALMLLLGLQAASAGAIAERPGGYVVLGAGVALSRWLLSVGCRTGLTAMPGSRLGAALVGTVPGWQAALWASLLVGGLGGAAYAAGWPWWQGVAAGLLAVALAGWIVRRSSAVFGGVNGDVMGAAIEVGLTGLLVVLACR